MRISIALVAVAALALAVWAWRSPEPAPAGDRAAPVLAEEAQPTPAAAGTQRPVADLPPALAPSLAGSEPDGALVVDAAGRFVPTPSALRLFDHYLSASGEVSQKRILARIETAIAELPESAQADARALLRSHLAYREAARTLHAEGLAEDDLETRHQRLRELRRGVFGAETAALLFEEEEQMARVAIALRRIERDPDLSADEKAARRAAAEAELPESIREARRRATLPAELARQAEALRAAGASEGDVRALRERQVGAEAADRLEALDARRAEWTRRITAYRAERDFLLDEPSAESDRGAALERLRQDHFSGPELIRIRALDRVEGIERAP